MTGIWSGDGGPGRNLQEGDTYEIDLIEATPSVDSSTLVIVSGPITAGDNFFTADGNALEVENGTSVTLTAGQFAVEGTRLLVTAPLDTHTGGYTGEFALISVDNATGAVDGMVKKSGEDLVKVAKVPGMITTVSNQTGFVAPEWSCSSDGVVSLDPSQGGGQPETLPTASPADAPTAPPTLPGRRRMADGGESSHGHGNRHGHDHDNDYRDHDGHGHDGHHHKHHHGVHDDDFLSQLRSDLGNSRVDMVNRRRVARKNRELYPTDKYPQLYSYEVDLYIEIDATLYRNQNSDATRTIAYVNALVTAASAIFEKEIDTRREYMFSFSFVFCGLVFLVR